jgi:parallel beta-helix repeat protein
MVDGKPLTILDEASNQVVDGSGQVYLFHCNNIVVKNTQPFYDYGRTIQLVETKNSEVLNCKGYLTLTNSSQNTIHDNSLITIDLDTSSYNRIFANKIADTGVCVKLYKSSNYNEIYGNILSDTRVSAKADKIHKLGLNTAGIQLGDAELGGCQFNKIHDNTIAEHDVGLECFLSSNNTIYANSISSCKAGIQLGSSNQNNISQNNVTACTYAVSIYAASSNNAFYQNNFFGNQMQCFETHKSTLLSPGDSYSTNNAWDNGEEGNYWSNYNGTDANGDGIGDEAFTVFEKMVDNYPLMKPYAMQASRNNESRAVPLDQNPTATTPTPSPEATPTIELFPAVYIVVAVGVVVAVIAGLLLYFKKLIW